LVVFVDVWGGGDVSLPGGGGDGEKSS
jgi:hypothetical protein